MTEFLKKNWVTVLIVIATVILAGVAIYTAIRLYQLRQTTVAPNVPSSQPAAAPITNCSALATEDACDIDFCEWNATESKCVAVSCTTYTTEEACLGATCKWDADSNVCSQGNVCEVNFALTVGSPSPTATATSSASPTATPSGSPAVTPTPTATSTPTPPLSCGDSCSSNSDCANSMVCSSNGVCRNPSCLNATNCICATSTPSGTATTPPVVGTTTPAPELPQAGTSLPALVGAAAGILLLLGAFILAL